MEGFDLGEFVGMINNLGGLENRLRVAELNLDAAEKARKERSASGDEVEAAQQVYEQARRQYKGAIASLDDYTKGHDKPELHVRCYLSGEGYKVAVSSPGMHNPDKLSLAVTYLALKAQDKVSTLWERGILFKNLREGNVIGHYLGISLGPGDYNQEILRPLRDILSLAGLCPALKFRGGAGRVKMQLHEAEKALEIMEGLKEYANVTVYRKAA